MMVFLCARGGRTDPDPVAQIDYRAENYWWKRISGLVKWFRWDLKETTAWLSRVFSLRGARGQEFGKG